MSIKARLLLTISVLIAAAFTVIGAVTVTITRDRMLSRVDDTLNLAGLRAPRPGEDGNLGSDSIGGNVVGRYAQRATATIVYDAAGNVQIFAPSGFADGPDPLPDVTPSDLARRAGTTFTTVAADGSPHRFRVRLMRLGNGSYLAIAAPLDDVDQTIRNLVAVIAVTGLAVLGGVILVVWFTIRHALRPIDAMISTAGLIASGDLSQRVEHDNAATEVGQLGSALNAMLARIEASFAAKESSERRLRRFVADASHELRTPLTSIRGYAELYRSGAASTPEAVGSAMARIESEGARMGQLVEDLLLLARLDQGRPQRRAPLDLARLVSDAVADARVVDPTRPLAYAPPSDSSALVNGDAGRLRQVVDNLLVNARVHTPPNTPVRVAIATTEAEVAVTVADEGEGLAPDDAARVFDRFYRADTSRARAAGGTGLGLAIVASLVAAHDGRVELDTAFGRGATFTVTLPRFAPAVPEPASATVAAHA